jgi:hypothetical protein
MAAKPVRSDFAALVKGRERHGDFAEKLVGGPDHGGFIHGG